MTHLYIRCARCVYMRSSPQTCMKAAVVLPATQTSMRGQSHTKSGTGDAFNFWFSSVFHKSGPKVGNSLGRHHLSLYTIFFRAPHIVLSTSTPSYPPWMSTCQFQDNLPLHMLERAPYSQPHTFSEHHTAAQKNKLEVQGTPL